MEYIHDTLYVGHREWLILAKSFFLIVFFDTLILATEDRLYEQQIPAWFLQNIQHV